MMAADVYALFQARYRSSLLCGTHVMHAINYDRRSERKVMKRLMRSLLASAIVLCTGTAWADSYDPASNRLTIDSVQLGNTVYTNVVVTVGNVLSVGGSHAASSPVTATCTPTNFTTAKFNAIALGMTLDQVSQVMGCVNNPAMTQRSTSYVAYAWTGGVGSNALIMVFFDVNGSAVTPIGNVPGGAFKQSSGF